MLLPMVPLARKIRTLSLLPVATAIFPPSCMIAGQLYKSAKRIITQRIDGEWKHLARAFDFQDTDIAAIQQSSHYNLHEEIHQLFVKWEKQCSGARCVYELLNALRKAAHDNRKRLLSHIAGDLLKLIIDSKLINIV